MGGAGPARIHTALALADAVVVGEAGFVREITTLTTMRPVVVEYVRVECTGRVLLTVVTVSMTMVLVVMTIDDIVTTTVKIAMTMVWIVTMVSVGICARLVIMERIGGWIGGRTQGPVM